jgi:hypothetical protein
MYVPDTWGAAMDVPLSVVPKPHMLSRLADTMSTLQHEAATIKSD